MHYSSKTHAVEEGRRVTRIVEPAEGPVPVTWAESEESCSRPGRAGTAPTAGSRSHPCPPSRSTPIASASGRRSSTVGSAPTAPLSLLKDPVTRLTAGRARPNGTSAALCTSCAGDAGTRVSRIARTLPHQAETIDATHPAAEQAVDAKSSSSPVGQSLWRAA